MTIFRINRRYYHGEKPHQCTDYTEQFVATLDLAHAYVKQILGEKAICDDSFGLFETWTVPHLPRIEYLVDSISVLAEVEK